VHPHLAHTAFGHTSRLRRSIIAPLVLDPLRLLAASSEFPGGARHLFAATYEGRAEREPANSSGAR